MGRADNGTKTPSNTISKIDTLKTDKVVSPKTAAASNGLFYMMRSLSAGIGAVFFWKKKKQKIINRV